MPKHNWEQFFPFTKIREHQKRAIEFAIDQFESGKRIVVLEMGTGTGKSATAITIAKYLSVYGEQSNVDDKDVSNSAYILTTKKILQKQYVNDFGDKKLIASIKSASNYQCCSFNQSCQETRSMLQLLKKQNKFSLNNTNCDKNCNYAYDKFKFLNSDLSITNFSYFLAASCFSNDFNIRNILVIDEAHNIENELSKFIEISISSKFVEILNINIPNVTNDLNGQHQIYNWICKEYNLAIDNMLRNLNYKLNNVLEINNSVYEEHQYKELLSEERKKQLIDINKKISKLKNHKDNIQKFINGYDSKNWVMNITKEFDQVKITFKPVDIAKFSNEYLFKYGHRYILLMSATIVNNPLFCGTIGIPHWETAYLNIPSPFSVKNKPIHYLPVGSMSLNSIDLTLPKMIKTIEQLINEIHQNDKGIIHCVNYKIAQFLFKNIKTNRFLIHDSKNRDIILKQHIESDKPTIILSPSMVEGVDLADESSRFQILCKLPFPYLGDNVIKKRMENNKLWYTFQTVKTIIQSLGRSIRNEKDYAVSYILDQDWTVFYSKNKSLFPRDFIVE